MAKHKKKFRHGGKRPGAGGTHRKFAEVHLTYSFLLTPAQAKLLKTWGGGNASAGLRWLIEAAQTLVRRSGE